MVLSNVIVDVTIEWYSATCITYSTDCYQRLTLETNQIYNQSIIPSPDVIQLTSTPKMSTAQFVETSVTVNNNSPLQGYVHLDDQTQPTSEMTPGFKPFTTLFYLHWEHLFFICSYIFFYLQLHFFICNNIFLFAATFFICIGCSV